MPDHQKKSTVIFFALSLIAVGVFAGAAGIIKGGSSVPQFFEQSRAQIVTDAKTMVGLESKTSSTPMSYINGNPNLFSDLPMPASTTFNSQTLQNLVITTLLPSTTPSQANSTPPTPVDDPVLQGTPLPPQSVSLQNLGSPSVLANWTAGSRSTLAPNTLFYTQGEQSLSLTTDGQGDPAVAKVVDQGPYNLTNKYFEIWVRVSTTTDIDDLWFSASSDDLDANYYTWKLNEQLNTSLDESEIQPGEWVPIVLTFDVDGENTTMTGSPDLTKINSFELYARDDGTAPFTVLLGGISSVQEPPQAVLSIVLDNGWISEYTLAMPTLAKYGFPAVIAEIPETANAPAFMSTAQLQYLQNNLGWDIACHTWDHEYQLGLPSVSTSTMDSEFQRCQNWLVDNDMSRASNILVWPDGSNSPTAIAEASKYFVTARGIVGTAFNTLPPANPMMLYATEFGGTTPTSTLDADVDRCMANHEWCIFYGHIITTSTPQDNNQYSSADFNDFIAHIAAVGIPVKTLTQVLASEPSTPSWTPIPPSSGADQVVAGASPMGTISSPVSLPFTQNSFGDVENWESTWGNFSASSASFTLGAKASTTGGSATLAGLENWGDYEFNAVFDWVKGETVSLIARYQNNENYVECQFQAEAPGVNIELVQYINGVPYQLAEATDLNDNGIGEANIDAYIKVQGTQGICSFNNHVISDQENGFTINPPFTGSVGFDTWDPQDGNSEIIVRQVSATAL